MFDFDLAIARLDAAATFGDADGHKDLARLRPRYPELDFVFDELETLREAETVGRDEFDQLQDAADAEHETVVELRARVGQMQAMLATLEKMDAAAGIRAELAHLVTLAEETRNWNPLSM